MDDAIYEKARKSQEKAQKDLDKKDNVSCISFLETDDLIVEEAKATSATLASHGIAIDNKNIFITYNKENGDTKVVEQVKISEKTYKPINDRLSEKGAVLLPVEPEEYNSDKELVEEIKKFLFNYFDLNDFFKKFLPYLVLFYWIYDKFPFVPYVHFVGRTSTGKTTAMEVFGSICYKPIDASGSITLASIFRVSSTWKGTLLLDEFESIGESNKEIIAFLKMGVGDKFVLRTEGDSKKEVEAYSTKAPKLFTSENPVTDAGLRSRTIVIKMEENKTRIPLYRLNQFLEDAQNLRNKLLLWRFRNLNKVSLKAIEYGITELSGFDRRVQQVITPIYYLADEETRKEIVEFAKEQEEETKRERKDSLDGSIFEVIFEASGREVTLDEVTKKLNEEREDLGYKRPFSPKYYANVVRQKLGFDIKRRGHENIPTIITEGKEEKVKSLAIYYGLVLPETAVARDASSANTTPDPNGSTKKEISSPEVVSEHTKASEVSEEDTWTEPPVV